jgi:hypothetical protein
MSVGIGHTGEVKRGRRLAVLALLIALMAPAVAQARVVGAATAKRVIHADAPTIALSVSSCHHSQGGGTSCTVRATLVVEESGRVIGSTSVTWTDRVYVRGHRLLIAESEWYVRS